VLTERLNGQLHNKHDKTHKYKQKTKQGNLYLLNNNNNNNFGRENQSYKSKKNEKYIHVYRVEFII
jgi:hypothetical protein